MQKQHLSLSFTVPIVSHAKCQPNTGKPDQMTRILDDANEILYFTEEQGVDNGVHACVQWTLP